MKAARYIFVTCVAVGLVMAVLLIAGPGKGEDKSYEFHHQSRDKVYELHPQIILPEYGTDTGYSVDTYQRLMDSYMSIMDDKLTSLKNDMRDIFRELDSINSKLDELSQKMTAIENELGIEQPALQKTDVIQEPTGSKKIPDNQIKTNIDSN